MVVLRDDATRGGEGALLLAAEFVSPAAINFMVRRARGLVWLALSAERCDELGLSPIESRGESSLTGSSMVSIEAKTGVTTGISAADRARTIEVAVDPRSGHGDLVQPGHVLPLRARAGGLLEHPGRAEIAIDLVESAGLRPACVLCDVMRDDGRMSTGEDLDQFTRDHRLEIVAASELLELRLSAGRSEALASF